MVTPKHDWKSVVADSNGTMIYLPDGFSKAQQELDEKRKGYNTDAIKMAEREITMNIATQNMFFEIRKHLAKNGYPDIWVKELGFEANALKEGHYILTIRDSQ